MHKMAKMQLKLNKLNKKWAYCGAGALAVLLLIILITSLAGGKECPDSYCFISAADSCKDVSWTDYTQDGEVFEYSANDCVMNKTLLVAGLDEPEEVRLAIEGKSLSCKYNKGEFNANWLITLSVNLENCEGELKEVIEDLGTVNFEAASPEPATPSEEVISIPTVSISGSLKEGESESYDLGDGVHTVKIDSVLFSARASTPSLVDLTFGGKSYSIEEGKSIVTSSGIKITIVGVYDDGSVSFTLESFD